MVEEMEADRTQAFELAAARGAVEASALLTRAFAESGLTQRELAEQLGVTEGRVSQVLGAEVNPRVSTVARYLHAMGYRLRLAAASLIDGHLVANGGHRMRGRSLIQPPSALYVWPVEQPTYRDVQYVRADGVGTALVIRAVIDIAQEDPRNFWPRESLGLPPVVMKEAMA